jgi:spermidine synthase
MSPVQTNSRAPISVARGGLVAFLVASATLFVQVLVHRIVSAKLLNNYAFLVISLTMLGFAISGVILTRMLPRALEHLEDFVATCAVLFALSFLLTSAFFYRAGADLYVFGSRPEFVGALLRTLPLSLLYAVPFLFAGLILGALLGSADLPAQRIYCFDLVGSALGAIAVLPAISSWGVERASLMANLALIVGTCLILPPRRAAVRALAGAGALLILVGFAETDRIFYMVYPAGSMLAASQGPNPNWRVEHVVWDPVARIEVTQITPPPLSGNMYPCLIGDDRGLHNRIERLITQNNYAFTYALHYTGKKEELKGIDRTIYAAAYEAGSAPTPRVLVIGVGGGFDILTALAFDPSKVTAVEVNGATVGVLRGTYRDYFKGWVEDPRVELVNAEGRNFLARSADRYDVIQLSGVDSYSGTSGSAHVFSENYLYTEEAFDLYLSRLSDRGILNVMRLEWHPASQMLKALVTAVASLRRMGVENVRDHIVLISAKYRNFTALLVKRTAFMPEEIARLDAWVNENPFIEVAGGPQVTTSNGYTYEAFLSLGEPRKEAAFVSLYPFDIRPATDDRPFFFRSSYWWHLFPSDPAVWGVPPFLEYSLIVLVFVVGIAAFVCIYMPLWLMGSPRLLTEQRWRYAAYCAGIALGYLAVEMAFLQKFGLFLGHPNYAISVVLASLLFTTGIGSLVSAVLLRRLGGIRFVAYALAFLILIERSFAFPLLPSMITLGFAARALLVAGLVAPIGLLLGVFFPTVLETLKTRAPAFVPWAWGVNGIFSVLAPILSVGVSTTWGVNALFIAAIPVYLLAAFALP